MNLEQAIEQQAMLEQNIQDSMERRLLMAKEKNLQNLQRIYLCEVRAQVWKLPFRSDIRNYCQQEISNFRTGEIDFYLFSARMKQALAWKS